MRALGRLLGGHRPAAAAPAAKGDRLGLSCELWVEIYDVFWRRWALNRWIFQPVARACARAHVRACVQSAVSLRWAGRSFPGRAECTSKQEGARPLLFRARTRAFLCHQLGECDRDSFELGCTLLATSFKNDSCCQLSASSSTRSRCGMSNGFAMWPFMPAFSAFWRSSSKAFAVIAKMGVFALRSSAMARIRRVAS